VLVVHQIKIASRKGADHIEFIERLSKESLEAAPQIEVQVSVAPDNALILEMVHESPLVS
jgi:hypothetical protein